MDWSCNFSFASLLSRNPLRRRRKKSTRDEAHNTTKTPIAIPAFAPPPKTLDLVDMLCSVGVLLAAGIVERAIDEVSMVLCEGSGREPVEVTDVFDEERLIG